MFVFDILQIPSGCNRISSVFSLRSCSYGFNSDEGLDCDFTYPQARYYWSFREFTAFHPAHNYNMSACDIVTDPHRLHRVHDPKHAYIRAWAINTFQ